MHSSVSSSSGSGSGSASASSPSLGSFLLSTHRDFEILRSQLDSLQSSAPGLPALHSLRSSLFAAEERFRLKAAEVLNKQEETKLDSTNKSHQHSIISNHAPLASTLALLDSELRSGRRSQRLKDNPALEAIKQKQEKRLMQKPSDPNGRRMIEQKYGIASPRSDQRSHTVPIIGSRAVQFPPIPSASTRPDPSSLSLQSSKVNFHQYHEQFNRANRFVQLAHSGGGGSSGLMSAGNFPQLDLSEELINPEAAIKKTQEKLLKEKEKQLAAAEETRLVRVDAPVLDLPLYEPFDENEATFVTQQETGGQMHSNGANELVPVDMSSSGAVSSQSGPILSLMPGEAEAALQPVVPPSLLLISKGRFVRSNVEFQRFYRQYSYLVSSLDRILEQFEHFCAHYSIRHARIILDSLVRLLQNSRLKRSNYQLLYRDYLDCFYCPSSAESDPTHELFRKLPGLKYRHFQTELARSQYAATRIQALIRGFLARVKYLRWKTRKNAAIRIQRFWRRVSSLKRTRSKILDLYAKRYSEWQSNVQQKWIDGFAGRREPQRIVLIQLLSLSLPESQRSPLINFNVHENAAFLSRLTDIKDFPRIEGDTVEIVYISPYRFNEDIRQYAMKFLEIGESGLNGPGSASGLATARGRKDSAAESLESRIQFIVPDSVPRMANYHLPLSKFLLYSPRTLQHIRSLIRGKHAILMPNIANFEDIQVALELNVPIYSMSDPATVKSAIHENKSHSKRILLAATKGKVSIPIGVHDLYTEEDFYLYFARLLLNNLFMERWIMKINDYCWPEGAGTAVFQIANLLAPGAGQQSNPGLPAHSHASHHPLFDFIHRLRLDQLIHTGRFHLPEVQSANIERLSAMLRKYLWAKVKLVSPNTFANSVEEYFRVFLHHGGVIEAFPSSVLSFPTVSMLIQPDGSIVIISSHERLFAPPPHAQTAAAAKNYEAPGVAYLDGRPPLSILDPSQHSFVPVGVSFPCTRVPSAQLHSAAIEIARSCHREGIIGYVSIDFMFFLDNHFLTPLLPHDPAAIPARVENEIFGRNFGSYFRFAHSQINSALHQTAHGKPSEVSLNSYASMPGSLEFRAQLWATDLHFYPTPALAAFKVFHFLMQGEYRFQAMEDESYGDEARYLLRDAKSPSNSQSTLASPLSPYRSFTSFPFLYHPHFSSLQFHSFFQSARFAGLNFDVRAKIGTTFLLVDSFASGSLGILTVQESQAKSLESMRSAVKFLETNLGSMRFPGANQWLFEEETLTQASKAIKELMKRLTNEERNREREARKGHTNTGNGTSKKTIAS